MDSLDKYLGGADGSASSSENRRTMEKALERFQGQMDSSKPATATHSAEPPPLPAPETLRQECVCAIYDLPFIVNYQRQANGRFRATGSEKIHSDNGLRAAGTSNRGEVTLPVDEIDGGHTACAWCGSFGHYHCSCGAVVCGGKLRDKLFTCRASCGQSWETGTATAEIKARVAPTDNGEWEGPRKPRLHLEAGSQQLIKRGV